MPELPEVESIIRSLTHGCGDIPTLVGKTILDAQVLWERSLANYRASEFCFAISGQDIQSLSRRGKFLRFDLSQDVMLIHLRMSGDLWTEAETQPMAPHNRIVFSIGVHRMDENRFRLAFNDPRKFGRVWLTTQPQQILDKLGPEPLDDGFTSNVLWERLHMHHRQIKPLLMDQSFIAGLGNIYTDEILHLAAIHPLTRSDEISKSQSDWLWQAVRKVLQEGIQHNGASIDWVYRGGKFQNYFRVYQRHGKDCITCHTPIERITIAQRSSYFCPTCQK